MADHILFIPSTAVEIMPGTADSDADLKNTATVKGAITASITHTILKPYIRLWLRLRYATAPAGTSGVSVWMLNSIDGTNFEDGSVSSKTVTRPARGADWLCAVRAVDTQQVIASPLMIAPHRNFKLLVYNGENQALTNTDNENELWYEFVSEGPVAIA